MSTSTQSLEQMLAGAGVATVADETSSVADVPVVGRRVFTITQWQATNMSEEIAAHDGLLGSDLNAMLPMPPRTPQIDDIIGGWIQAQADPKSVAAGRLLGSPDWAHPEQIVFPTAVITLFMGDLLQHVAPATPTGSTTSATSPASYQGPAPEIQDASIVTAPCSTVQNFVDTVLDQVFSLLKVDPAAVAAWVNGAVGGGLPGAIVGTLASFLATFWNHAVDLARQAVENVIKQITRPVIDTMATVIGAIAVFTTVRSYLKQWTAKVTPTPASNFFNITPTHNPGNFSVVVDAKAEVADWPSQLIDCADTLKIPLPKLAKEGSPVTWTVGGQRGLVTTAPSDLKGTLDKSLTNTLRYATGTEGAFLHHHGLPKVGTVVASVAIERPELQQLRDLITNYLTGRIPPPVQPYLGPILADYVRQATEFLNTLTAVRGSSPLDVTYHVPKPCKVVNGAIPEQKYTGQISARLTTKLHLTVSGVHIPNGGGGVESLKGTVSITSTGSEVSGTMVLSGTGASHVGLPGAYNVHSGDRGTLRVRISGSARHPVVNGTLNGAWRSFDAPVINGSGRGSSHVHAGLHLTRVGCSSISGNVIPLFMEIAAPVAKYLKLGGTGAWTARGE